MNILHIDSSITGDASVSRTLSKEIVARLTHSTDDAEVTYRDLAAEPLDHLTLPAFATEESQVALAQFKAAEVVVIGAPMYNFTIPSQLKAWIDRVLIAGETFRYTQNGPEGLAGDKRVIVGLSRGSLYGEDNGMRAFEHVETYLTGAFAFVGVTNVEFVIAEGLKVSEETAAAALASARGAIASL
mgnify:CR=1 FL=1